MWGRRLYTPRFIEKGNLDSSWALTKLVIWYRPHWELIPGLWPSTVKKGGPCKKRPPSVDGTIFKSVGPGRFVTPSGTSGTSLRCLCPSLWAGRDRQGRKDRSVTCTLLWRTSRVCNRLYCTPFASVGRLLLLPPLQFIYWEQSDKVDKGQKTDWGRRRLVTTTRYGCKGSVL